MAIAAVGNNLITYVINEMHFSLSEAANIVTNFIGTVFIVGLLGGNLSDSYLGCFWTLLVSGFVELSVPFLSLSSLFLSLSYIYIYTKIIASKMSTYIIYVYLSVFVISLHVVQICTIHSTKS